jgi:hypothetical protein
MTLARVDDISLIDMPADATKPRSINCYFAEVENAAAIGADGKKFKIEPQRLLYSLQWKAQRHAAGFASTAREGARSLVRRNDAVRRTDPRQVPPCHGGLTAQCSRSSGSRSARREAKTAVLADVPAGAD